MWPAKKCRFHTQALDKSILDAECLLNLTPCTIHSLLYLCQGRIGLQNSEWASTCDANASLSSKRSMLSMLRPADFTAAGMATEGPIPMMAGSTPTAEKLLKMAMIGKPRLKASRLVVSTTAAAPSLTCTFGADCKPSWHFQVFADNVDGKEWRLACLRRVASSGAPIFLEDRWQL